MRVYHADQNNMLFLSPYTVSHFDGTTLHLSSTLFDTSVLLPCTQQQAQALLNLLQQGVSEEALHVFFRETLPALPLPQLLHDWMRKGVLE